MMSIRPLSAGLIENSGLAQLGALPFAIAPCGNAIEGVAQRVVASLVPYH